MKLLVASDLHVEFHADRGESFLGSMPEADVFVCAGDLGDFHTFPQALRWLCARYPTVVYVLGNHECYHASIGEARALLVDLAAELPNLVYLDNAIASVGGFRFLGTTLWTPRQPGIEAYEPYLNDFRLIADAPDAIYDENRRAVAWLEENVSRGDVVVTHHLPTPGSVHAEYEGDPLNLFFLCDLGPLVASRGPALWIHGHTHKSCDYRWGDTRVVCNPLGYAGHSLNGDFDPHRAFVLRSD